MASGISGIRPILILIIDATTVILKTNPAMSIITGVIWNNARNVADNLLRVIVRILMLCGETE